MFGWMLKRLLRPFGASGAAPPVIHPHASDLTGHNGRIVDLVGYDGLIVNLTGHDGRIVDLVGDGT
jgi:hypothetical protein